MKQVLILSLLVILLYLALAYGLYTGLTARAPGANDFYSRWEGARALFLRGENPYSAGVTREIQMGMYGRPARADEDQVAFAYPLYTAFVMAPLVVLPYAQAQALWMAFLIMAVVAGTVALTKVYQIQLTPIQFGGLVIGLITFYPMVRGVFLGQLALASFFFLALAVWAVKEQLDLFAGVVLAFATIKPQPMIFLLPAILLWAVWQRRWRVVGTTIVTLAILFIAALAFVPTWPLDFVQGVQHYSVYEPVGPPVQTMIELVRRDSIGFYVSITLAIALVGWMGWRVLNSLNGSWEDFQPALALVAIVTTWTAGRVGTPDQMFLLFPLLFWMGSWRTAPRQVAGAALVGTFIVLPWFVFLATLRGNAENVIVTLVLPMLAIGVPVWSAVGSRWLVIGSAAR